MQYHSMDQLTEDMNLLVDNAKTFNPVGTPVHIMALDLHKVYKEKLISYKGMFDDIQAERKKRKKEKKDKKKDKQKK